MKKITISKKPSYNNGKFDCLHKLLNIVKHYVLDFKKTNSQTITVVHLFSWITFQLWNTNQKRKRIFEFTYFQNLSKILSVFLLFEGWVPRVCISYIVFNVLSTTTEVIEITRLHIYAGPELPEENSLGKLQWRRILN